MTWLLCDGWWEQPGFGRQPMRQLRLRLDEHINSGSGTDVVGRFVFDGTLQDSTVTLIRQNPEGSQERCRWQPRAPERATTKSAFRLV